MKETRCYLDIKSAGTWNGSYVNSYDTRSKSKRDFERAVVFLFFSSAFALHSINWLLKSILIRQNASEVTPELTSITETYLVMYLPWSHFHPHETPYGSCALTENEQNRTWRVLSKVQAQRNITVPLNPSAASRTRKPLRKQKKLRRQSQPVQHGRIQSATLIGQNPTH